MKTHFCSLNRLMCVRSLRARTLKTIFDYAWLLVLVGGIFGLLPSQARADIDSYCAIVYSQSTGDCAWAYGHPTLKSAEKAALNQLTGQARSDAKLVTWARNGYYATLVRYADGTISYGSGASKETAIRAAVGAFPTKSTKDAVLNTVFSGYPIATGSWNRGGHSCSRCGQAISSFGLCSGCAAYQQQTNERR